MENTTSLHHTPRTAWLILAACAVVYVLYAVHFLPWAEDDAFITFRYGAHVAFGVGLEFNPNDAVEGYSNLLWVLLAALTVKMGGDPLLVARLVGLASGLATLFVAWRLAVALIGRPSRAALLAPAFLALTPVLPRHAVTGLETVFYTFLLAAGTWLACALPLRRSAVAMTVVTILLALTRPEGWVFAAVLLAWREGRREREGVAGSGRYEWVIFAVAMAAYLAWRWKTFGALMPNTGHAKMTGEALAWIEGVHHSLDFLRETGGGVLVGLFAANLTRRRVPDTWVLFTMLIMMQSGLVVLVGGDWMHFYRFFAPVMPLLGAGAAGGLAVLAAAIDRTEWTTRRRLLARLAIGVALAVSLMHIAKTERAASRLVLPAVKEGAYLTDAYRKTADWIDTHVDPGHSVAACDIGVLGWELDRVIVDMFGLIDPHVARQPGRPHFKSDADHVMSRNPGVVVLVRDADGGYLRVPDQAMIAHPGFAARYRLTHQIPVGFRDETVEIYLPDPSPTE